MRRNGWAILAATAAFMLCAALYLTVGAMPAAADNSYWGANYFPNVPLITQDGKTIHFYDDMLRGKIVLINFIYTECGETCPLETAKLVQVYKLLGDHMGKTVEVMVRTAREMEQAVAANPFAGEAGNRV